MVLAQFPILARKCAAKTFQWSACNGARRNLTNTRRFSVIDSPRRSFLTLQEAQGRCHQHAPTLLSAARKKNFTRGGGGAGIPRRAEPPPHHTYQEQTRSSYLDSTVGWRRKGRHSVCGHVRLYSYVCCQTPLCSAGSFQFRLKSRQLQVPDVFPRLQAAAPPPPSFLLFAVEKHAPPTAAQAKGAPFHRSIRLRVSST